MPDDPTRSLDVLRSHGRLDPRDGPAGPASPASPEELLHRPGLWQPAADVAEGRDAWVIEVELPGLRRAEIILEVRPGELWVYGERRTDGEAPEGRCRVQERRRGPFARRFALPPDVDGMRIFAAFGNGLLTVTLPRRDARLDGRLRVPIA